MKYEIKLILSKYWINFSWLFFWKNNRLPYFAFMKYVHQNMFTENNKENFININMKNIFDEWKHCVFRKNVGR